jgi:hypothetical protein
MTDSELEVVDVERGGRWCQVLLLEVSDAATAARGAALLSATRDGTPYIGIVSADLGPDADGVLAALRPALHEIICCDSLAEPVVDGQDFAMQALEELGFGQDFVFTVPRLEDAVDHALGAVLEPGRGWEGRFVVVLGPEGVITRARRHLSGPC